MSLYRNLIAAVAAMTLATCVFATTETTSSTTTTGDDTTGATTTTTNQNVADATTDQTNAQTTTTTNNNNDTTTTTTTTTDVKVNLNTATAKDLMKVKGINAAKAKAIITYRKKNGDFKSVDDLKQVKGLNKLNTEKLQAIQDQLTV